MSEETEPPAVSAVEPHPLPAQRSNPLPFVRLGGGDLSGHYFAPPIQPHNPIVEMSDALKEARIENAELRRRLDLANARLADARLQLA